MASAQELVQQVRSARSELEATLGQCSDKWEVKPQGGEGEDAWCQKEVAQHVIGADWFFTNGIAQACGAPAMDRPSIDVATPQAALQSLQTVGAADDKILSMVQDGDLAKTFELRGLGSQSVEQMLQIMAGHARDHANQVQAAGA
jgi:hypothetical protein